MVEEYKMLLEFIVLSVIGIVFFIIGWLIWKWEKINLIHNYHYKNVAEADKKAYTALMGKGAMPRRPKPSIMIKVVGVLFITYLDFC